MKAELPDIQSKVETDLERQNWRNFVKEKSKKGKEWCSSSHPPGQVHYRDAGDDVLLETSHYEEDTAWVCLPFEFYNLCFECINLWIQNSATTSSIFRVASPDEFDEIVVVELLEQPECVPAADEDGLRIRHSLLRVAERVDAHNLNADLMLSWSWENAFLLGPKLLLPMGCVELGEKIAFTCLLWVNKPQINCPISRNPWEVIISGPVE